MQNVSTKGINDEKKPTIAFYILYLMNIMLVLHLETLLYTRQLLHDD